MRLYYMRVMLWVLVAVLPLSSAFADKVKLQNGAVIEGIVKEDGEKVVLETGLGVVEFDRKDVETIEKCKSKLEEYYEKFEGIKDSKNADDFYKLAKWADENKLPKFVRKLYEKTIELNPDHEGARKALGYQLYQGKWMIENEVMTAKGFIKFRDKWMTEAEKELIIAQEKEKEAEEAKEKLEKELADKEVALKKAKESQYTTQTTSPSQIPNNYSYYQYGTYGSPYAYFPYNTYVMGLPNYYGGYPDYGYSSFYTMPYYNYGLFGLYGLSGNFGFNRCNRNNSRRR